MSRLTLLTGWSVVVSTTDPTAGLAAAFGTPLATVEVGVAPAFAAPGALVEAALVLAGTSLAGGRGADGVPAVDACVESATGRVVSGAGGAGTEDASVSGALSFTPSPDCVASPLPSGNRLEFSSTPQFLPFWRTLRNGWRFTHRETESVDRPRLIRAHREIIEIPAQGLLSAKRPWVDKHCHEERRARKMIIMARCCYLYSFLRN